MDGSAAFSLSNLVIVGGKEINLMVASKNKDKFVLHNLENLSLTSVGVYCSIMFN